MMNLWMSGWFQCRPAQMALRREPPCITRRPISLMMFIKRDRAAALAARLRMMAPSSRTSSTRRRCRRRSSAPSRPCRRGPPSPRASPRSEEQAVLGLVEVAAGGVEVAPARHELALAMKRSALAIRMARLTALRASPAGTAPNTLVATRFATCRPVFLPSRANRERTSAP
jgi:hypothetical protein